MKCLFVNYEFPPLGGGGGTTTMYIAKALAGFGHSVRIITAAHHSIPHYQRKDGYEIIRIRCKRTSISQCSMAEMLSFLINVSLPLLKQVKSFEPDLVHIFFALPTGPLGWLVKKVYKTPYIVSLLGGDVPGFLPDQIGFHHKLLRGVSHAVWKNASYVVANSSGLCRLGNKAFPDIPIKVITNGISTEDFRPLIRRPIQKGKLRLLFVARLAAQKGIMVLLKAISSLANDSGAKNLELIIVGEGPEKEMAVKFIQEHGLIDICSFVGWVPLTELCNTYNQADVFVLPSLYEGMPSVVLQALACGMPVISTKVFGSEDLIEDGKNGFLVEINSSEALSAAINHLYSSPELLEEMGRNAIATANKYDWKEISKEYLRLYQS